MDIKLECLDNLTDLLKRFGREVESEVRRRGWRRRRYRSYRNAFFVFCIMLSVSKEVYDIYFVPEEKG